MMECRVVAFTPGPPSQSGGAVYAATLLPALARHTDVVAVSDEPMQWDGPSLSLSEFQPQPEDVLIHFLGNNPGHMFAYRSALQWGGIVVCHDVGLRHVLNGFAREDEVLDLTEQVGPAQAAAVRARWDRGVATELEAFLFTLVSRPLRTADAVVVHSRFAKFVVESELLGVPVHTVPSHTGAIPTDIGDGASVRAGLGFSPRDFVVGMFGYLGGHKRVPQALAAVARAVPEAARQGVPIRLLTVGTELGIDLRHAVQELGLADVSTVVGPVDDRRFFEHMAAVDVVVNLRYPTVGETSATLVQAMHLGKPVITTDHAQFAEERAAIHVAPDAAEVDHVAAALVRLACCRHCRSLVAEASRSQAAAWSVDRVAERYLEVVDLTRRRGGVSLGAGS